MEQADRLRLRQLRFAEMVAAHADRRHAFASGAELAVDHARGLRALPVVRLRRGLPILGARGGGGSRPQACGTGRLQELSSFHN